MEYINLGSTPCDEDCAQVGDADYDRRATEECYRYIQRIRDVVGPEPEGASLRIKSFNHDFGPYKEVVCYHNNRPEAIDYVFWCESHGPLTWKGHESRPWVYSNSI
jgi:hypothetical protein